MRKTLLLAALLIGVTRLEPGAALAADRHGAWGFVAGPSRIVPFPYARTSPLPLRLEHGVLAIDLDRDRRLGPAAWRYAPDPYCVAPYCLPSYYRPVFPRFPVLRSALPLVVVLERLRRLDFEGYGVVVLNGPNYQISAVDRYGRPVYLTVNAGNGLVRRVVILPQY